MDRRRLLQSLQSSLAASLVPSLLPSLARAARPIAPAALLVPLSGASAALGRSMARAALLAQAPGSKVPIVIDTGGTPEGAADAARQALKRGAGLILGPLLAAEVRPVLAAVAGRIPVITFSNDAGLIESGAFLLGITAEQAVAPLLHYARTRGVRSVAIVGDASAWSLQAGAAAIRAGQSEGLAVSALPAMPAGLRGPATPDAILFTGGTPAPSPADARAAGIQPLVAFAGLDPSPAALTSLDGAWLSAPDPAAFATFATAYEAANGSPPGVIAGLARDAAAIAAILIQGGGTDRSALLATASFEGVCGDIRFRADGSAVRTMAIIVVEGGQYRVVDRA